MDTVTTEMPLVSSCEASHCVYNLDKSCHAKAITVGDFVNPECDTFLGGSGHIKELQRNAGVGACKVGNCKYNKDFECNASQIRVGFASRDIKCLTYVSV